MLKPNDKNVLLTKLKNIPQILHCCTSFIDYLVDKNILKDQVNVLSHNDLLPGNILFDLNLKKYQFIDFEYSGFNIIGADIVNILIESTYTYDTGVWPDFKRNNTLFGSSEELEQLIHFYLAYFKLFMYKNYKINFEYLNKIPSHLKTMLTLDFSLSYFSEDEHLLSKEDNFDNLSEFKNSKSYKSVTQDQINFVKK